MLASFLMMTQHLHRQVQRLTIIIGVTHAQKLVPTRNLRKFLKQVFFWYQKLALNRMQLYLVQVSGTCTSFCYQQNSRARVTPITSKNNLSLKLHVK